MTSIDTTSDKIFLQEMALTIFIVCEVPLGYTPSYISYCSKCKDPNLNETATWPSNPRLIELTLSIIMITSIH